MQPLIPISCPFVRSNFVVKYVLLVLFYEFRVQSVELILIAFVAFPFSFIISKDAWRSFEWDCSKHTPHCLSLNTFVNMSKKLKQSPRLCTLKSFQRIPATGVKANFIKTSISIIVNRTQFFCSLSPKDFSWSEKTLCHNLIRIRPLITTQKSLLHVNPTSLQNIINISFEFVSFSFDTIIFRVKKLEHFSILLIEDSASSGL